MVIYEIGSQEVLSVLENLGFDRVETEVGEAIEVNPYNGFLYSNVTGSGYLEDTMWQFTIKGLTQIFHTALRHDFVTGIFDGTKIDKSPLKMYEKRPFLFDEKKKIVPLEFRSRSNLQRKLKDFKEILGENAKNYLIQEVDLSKKGNGLEHFLEFLFLTEFKEKGYIVENQIPLGHSKGTPDVGAFSLSGSFPPGGFSFLELAMISVGHEPNFIDAKTDYETVVGEAKTSVKEMTTQLEKYLETGYFDVGFEVYPNKEKVGKPYFGLFSLEGENIKIAPPEKDVDFSNENKKEYQKWLENYAKFYLISNFDNEELKELYKCEMPGKLKSKEDLVNLIKKINLKRLYTVVSNG